MGRQKYQKPLSLSGQYNASRERQENIIGKRIAQARQKSGLSLTQFSQLLQNYGLSIQRQGLGKWESGDAVPNGYQLLAVCHALHIEDGIDYFTDFPKSRNALNQQGMKKLQDYREDLVASGRYTPEQEPREMRLIEMPVSILPASAGTGAFLEDEQFEKMTFPADTVPEQADFGVFVSGDSMEPRYHHGQIVWIQQCSSLTPGEVGLFLYDGNGYIKIYDQQPAPEEDAFLDTDGVLRKQPVLISCNNAYSPILVSPQLSFQIAGRVIS